MRTNIPLVHWFHVASSHNPADIATRSILLHTIDRLSWQKGPSFLLHGAEHWAFQDSISLSSEEMMREGVSESTLTRVNSKP